MPCYRMLLKTLRFYFLKIKYFVTYKITNNNLKNEKNKLISFYKKEIFQKNFLTSNKIQILMKKNSNQLDNSNALTNWKEGQFESGNIMKENYLVLFHTNSTGEIRNLSSGVESCYMKMFSDGIIMMDIAVCHISFHSVLGTSIYNVCTRNEFIELKFNGSIGIWTNQSHNNILKEFVLNSSRYR